MFKPLEVYVGLRYTRAKRRNHFISFISLSSMLGIALGVTGAMTLFIGLYPDPFIQIAGRTVLTMLR